MKISHFVALSLRCSIYSSICHDSLFWEWKRKGEERWQCPIDVKDTSKRKKLYIVTKIFSLPDMDNMNLWLSSGDCKRYTQTWEYPPVEDCRKYSRRDEQVTYEVMSWLWLLFCQMKQNKQGKQDRTEQSTFRSDSKFQYLYVFYVCVCDSIS